jgi:hypothetical protein
MDREHSLRHLRDTLTVAVFLLLGIGYVLPFLVPGGELRERLFDLLVFLHFLLPASAWGCHRMMRRWSGLPDGADERLCENCGHDMEGLPRDECPSCGGVVPPTKRIRR